MPMGGTPHCAGGFPGYAASVMSLISLVITLVVVGVLLWLVNAYIPMDGKIKRILNAVVVVCVIVWLLYAFGVLGGGGGVRVPQLR